MLAKLAEQQEKVRYIQYHQTSVPAATVLRWPKQADFQRRQARQAGAAGEAGTSLTCIYGETFPDDSMLHEQEGPCIILNKLEHSYDAWDLWRLVLVGI